MCLAACGHLPLAVAIWDQATSLSQWPTTKGKWFPPPFELPLLLGNHSTEVAVDTSLLALLKLRGKSTLLAALYFMMLLKLS